MEKFDTIIIGSGVGGLSTAICLARAGQKVLVLEQHYVPGGWAHSFTLNGQRFSPGEITDALKKPVVKDLLDLIRLRNTCEAFNGAFDLLPSTDETLHLVWTHAGARAELFVDFRDLGYKLIVTDKHQDGLQDLRFSHSLT